MPDNMHEDCVSHLSHLSIVRFRPRLPTGRTNCEEANPMTNIKEKCGNFRETLLSKFEAELVGPGSENCLPNREHEIITDFPEVRYSVGVLFPQNNRIEIDNDEIPISQETEEDEMSVVDEHKADDEALPKGGQYEGNIADDLPDDSLDEAVTLSMQNRPSSMGMTFFVDHDVKRIILFVSFATYQKTIWSDCLVPYGGTMSSDDIANSMAGKYIRLENGFLKLNREFTRKEAYTIQETNTIPEQIFVDAMYKLANQNGPRGFKRIPHKATVEIDFTNSQFNEILNLDNVDFAKLIAVKHSSGNDLVSITVMLVNSDEGGYTGTNSIFQPSISISTESNPHIHFVPYTSRAAEAGEDMKEQSLA